MAVPVWQPGLSARESKQIERVQKTALHVILGTEYTSYASALTKFGCESLEKRRIILCHKFAVKCTQNDKFKSWFSGAENRLQRKVKHSLPFKPVSTRTVRYERSPLPYLTRLLNEGVLST